MCGALPGLGCTFDPRGYLQPGRVAIMEESVMDDERFDRLIRLLGDGSARRGVLGTLAGIAGLGLGEAAAKRGKSKRGKSKHGAHASRQSKKVAICLLQADGTYRRIEVAESSA